jgi:hypothetical protein
MRPNMSREPLQSARGPEMNIGAAPNSMLRMHALGMILKVEHSIPAVRHEHHAGIGSMSLYCFIKRVLQ